MAIADGVPGVLTAVRESLRRGASQIKIAVGGGTGSYSDPLDVVEFTPDEIRAPVQAAGIRKSSPAAWGRELPLDPTSKVPCPRFVAVLSVAVPRR